MTDRDPIPALHRRPFDLMLVISFAAFMGTSLLFDRLAGLDLVHAGSDDPMVRALWSYAGEYDPLVAENPLFLRVMSWISAFVFGPFYAVLIYAFLRGCNWIRLPAIAFGSMVLYSVIVHVAAELLNERPPPNLAVFAAVYVPYALIPILLLVRMRRTPFPSVRVRGNL
jgi:hypothetical protein